MESKLGNRVYGFNWYAPLKNVVYKKREFKKKVSSTKDSKEALLDVIFAGDPITKLPTGDITIYMSENTSPEVKAFIQTQLFRDMSSQNENISHDGLSDDDVIKYSRANGESVSDYRERLIQVLKDERKSDKSE